MVRLLLAVCAFAGIVRPQELDRAAFARELAAIVPAADELTWRSLSWGSELSAAMIAASDAQKPVLLWAMNGHPLGQT